MSQWSFFRCGPPKKCPIGPPRPLPPNTHMHGGGLSYVPDGCFGPPEKGRWPVGFAQKKKGLNCGSNL